MQNKVCLVVNLLHASLLIDIKWPLPNQFRDAIYWIFTVINVCNRHFPTLGGFCCLYPFPARLYLIGPTYLNCSCDAFRSNLQSVITQSCKHHVLGRSFKTCDACISPDHQLVRFGWDELHLGWYSVIRAEKYPACTGNGRLVDPNLILSISKKRPLYFMSIMQIF